MKVVEGKYYRFVNIDDGVVGPMYFRGTCDFKRYHSKQPAYGAIKWTSGGICSNDYSDMNLVAEVQVGTLKEIGARVGDWVTRVSIPSVKRYRIHDGLDLGCMNSPDYYIVEKGEESMVPHKYSGSLEGIGAQDGDVVECVETNNEEIYTIGFRATIAGVQENGKPYFFVDNCPFIGDSGRWKIVTKAIQNQPVKTDIVTTTKTSIIEGEYGEVWVKEEYDSREGAIAKIKIDSVFSSTELTRAIETLITIRDGLIKINIE